MERISTDVVTPYMENLQSIIEVEEFSNPSERKIGKKCYEQLWQLRQLAIAEV